MEEIILENDIEVFYITAKSFPDGIAEAHKKLREIVPFSADRTYFGISRPENGTIVYKAATEEINKGEAEKVDCDTLDIKSGKYICLTINDFIKDIQGINRSFKTLLSHSRSEE